jgi:Fe-S-cluster containining protein
MISVEELKVATKAVKSENKKFFQKIKQKKPRNLDTIIQEIHEEVFAEYDCLTCANCCKTISPIIKMRDIERIAKHLRLSISQFIEKYLYFDEDEDYVFKSAPCPFLDSQNYCTIYEYRPDACRGYPHTDTHKTLKLLNIIEKNVEVCPATYHIIENLKMQLKI